VEEIFGLHFGFLSPGYPKKGVDRIIPEDLDHILQNMGQIIIQLSPDLNSQNQGCRFVCGGFNFRISSWISYSGYLWIILKTISGLSLF